MKTHVEIDAAICTRMARFEKEYMGREPGIVRVHLIRDLLVVRLTGVLTAAEQHLIQLLPAGKGRDLIKQVRTHLVETAQPILDAMIQEVTRASGPTPLRPLHSIRRKLPPASCGRGRSSCPGGR